MLNFLQFFDGIGHPLFLEIEADFGQTGQNRSDCVDIVDSPPGTPHIFLPRVDQKPQSLMDNQELFFTVIELNFSDAFEDVPHDICTRGVKNLCTFIEVDQFEHPFQ